MASSTAHLVRIRQLVTEIIKEYKVLFCQGGMALGRNVAICLCRQMIRSMLALLLFELRRPVKSKTTYTNKDMRRVVKKLWVSSAR